jgi:hypothetical protein
MRGRLLLACSFDSTEIHPFGSFKIAALSQVGSVWGGKKLVGAAKCGCQTLSPWRSPLRTAFCNAKPDRPKPIRPFALSNGLEGLR